MELFSITYDFTQRFPFPIDEVYAWATSYDPRDIERLGKQGIRRVRLLCDDTLLLSDTFHTGDGHSVRKPKLVQRYPRQHRWTNTHVGGPNRHSQYTYQLTADGPRACVLHFTGRQVIRGKAPPAEERARLARMSRADGVAMWKSLVAAMKAERRPRRA